MYVIVYISDQEKYKYVCCSNNYESVDLLSANELQHKMSSGPASSKYVFSLKMARYLVGHLFEYGGLHDSQKKYIRIAYLK